MEVPLISCYTGTDVSRNTAVFCPNLVPRYVWVYNAKPWPSRPREWPDTHLRKGLTGPRSGLVGVCRKGSPLHSNGIEPWVVQHVAKVYIDFDVSVLGILNNRGIFQAEYHIA